jgi:KaiC/GvpD/RAD55 family RecA-like ATPase
LQAHVTAEGCVALLLASGGRDGHHPEHAVVDGLLSLEDSRVGNWSQRELEVRKSRGSGALRGRHPYRITDGGLVVYPRVEAALVRPSRADDGPGGRVSLGVPGLDAMMGGGPPARTTTLLLGASGAGKTTIGLHFLALSGAEEPGLHFGFYETPERLLANAAAVGLDLAEPLRRGHLEVLWRPPTEQILDDLGGQLVDAVRRRGVRRLFVDGLGGYVEAADRRERVGRVFAALSNELRALGVTAIYTAETPNLVGPEVTVPVQGVSALTEDMLLLRFVEFRALAPPRFGDEGAGQRVRPGAARVPDHRPGCRAGRHLRGRGVGPERLRHRAAGRGAPCRRVAAAAAGPRRERARPGRRRAGRAAGRPAMATVLVVDDEFGVAAVVELALEDEGHRVVSAVNGRQGWSGWPKGRWTWCCSTHDADPGRARHAPCHAGGPGAARRPRGGDDLARREHRPAGVRGPRGLSPQAVPGRASSSAPWTGCSRGTAEGGFQPPSSRRRSSSRSCHASFLAAGFRSR